MLTFQPKTEDEIQTFNLIKPGEYPFKIKFAEPKTSQAGTPMIKLVVTVLADGRERNVFDYLMAIDAMQFKLRHFCYAVGLDGLYESGSLKPEDCVNRTGTCKIGVKEDKTGKYLPANIVLDYLKAENVTQHHAPKFDDSIDIPF